MTDGVPDDAPREQTVGGFDSSGRLWVLAMFGAGGAGLGALLPLLAGWAAELPRVPFQGPLRLAGSFDHEWLVWGRPALGLLVGLALAVWVILDSPVLTIGPERIQVRRRGEVQRVIEQSTVAAVYPKGSNIVIETDTGRTLFEGDVEGDRAQMRDALLEHGYPWEGPRD